MKPNSFLLKGAVALMVTAFAASCSNDDLGEPPAADGHVTFSASLDGAHVTRSYADGRSATNLKCLVYDHKGKFILSEDAVFSDLTANVDLQLISGETYDIVFFAYRDGSVYSIDAENHKMTVDYAKMNLANNDDDCFYIMKEGYLAGSSDTESVTLKRPVAQLNFGTNDLTSSVVEKTYGNGIYTQISFDAYREMDLLSGETLGEATRQVMTRRVVDDVLKAESFPVGGYEYMSMGYVLVPGNGSVSNVALEAFDGAEATQPTNTVELPNAPLKRNFRTNIYGSLLISSSDWQIDIDERFETPDLVMWDGISKKVPELVGDTYSVTEPAELAGLADMVAKGTDFAGKTIALTGDMHLGDKTFPGFGDKNHQFNGTLDGNGHTISHFNTNGDKIQPDYATGLVPNLGKKGTVRNLTVDSAVIGNLYNGKDNKKYVFGNIAGAVAGYCKGRIENVTVRNCKVYGYGKIGGLAGHDISEGSSSRGTYVNCKVTDTLICGLYNTAGLIGLTDYDVDLSTCTVEGITLEVGPYPMNGDWDMYQWIEVGRTKAVDKTGSGRQSVMVAGHFVPLGSTYYATGAQYYNRYDVDSGNMGLYITIDGTDHEIDGYPVNSPEGPERVD